MSEIDDYVRTNQRRYTREAIDDQLRAAGHDPSAIAAAWARFDADAAAGPPARPRSAAEWLGRLGLIAILAIPYGYLGFLGIAGIAFLSYPNTPTGPRGMLQGGLGVAFAGAMLIAFVFVARRILLGGTPSRRSWTISGSIGIAFLLLVGICGACIAGGLGITALRPPTQ